MVPYGVYTRTEISIAVAVAIAYVLGLFTEKDCKHAHRVVWPGGSWEVDFEACVTGTAEGAYVGVFNDLAGVMQTKYVYKWVQVLAQGVIEILINSRPNGRESKVRVTRIRSGACVFM